MLMIGLPSVVSWAIVWLPPVGSTLKHSMLTHMVLQIALLTVLGALLAEAWRRSDRNLISQLRPYRWAMLIVAATTLMLWMIPRLLDAAVQNVAVDALKVMSLAVGGAVLRLCWTSFGPVIRGLLHVEALASLWRIGWLYLESPTRLCSQYSIGDQQRVGNTLLVLGMVYALWLASNALGSRPLSNGISPVR